MLNKTCTICKSEMVERSTNKIGDTTYHMMYCEKCKRSVARSEF